MRRNNTLAAPPEAADLMFMYRSDMMMTLGFFTKLRPAGDVSFDLELRCLLQCALGKVTSQGQPMMRFRSIDLSNHAILVSIQTLPGSQKRRKLTAGPMLATAR